MHCVPSEARDTSYPRLALMKRAMKRPEPRFSTSERMGSVLLQRRLLLEAQQRGMLKLERDKQVDAYCRPRSSNWAPTELPTFDSSTSTNTLWNAGRLSESFILALLQTKLLSAFCKFQISACQHCQVLVSLSSLLWSASTLQRFNGSRHRSVSCSNV